MLYLHKRTQTHVYVDKRHDNTRLIAQIGKGITRSRKMIEERSACICISQIALNITGRTYCYNKTVLGQNAACLSCTEPPL